MQKIVDELKPKSEAIMQLPSQDGTQKDCSMTSLLDEVRQNNLVGRGGGDGPGDGVRDSPHRLSSDGGDKRLHYRDRSKTT